MNCKAVESRLSAYIDRELGGDELLEIRAHLSACTSCRDEAESIKSLKMLLGSVTCPEPPEHLCERLTASVLRERYEVPRRTIRNSFAMFAGIAACSMVVTLVVTGLFTKHAPPIAPSQDSSVTASQSNSNVISQTDDGAPFISVANYGPR